MLLQILQLAIVAETSPVIDATNPVPTDGALPVVSFSVAALLLPIMTLFM